MKCVIYCRLSRSKQTKGLSLDQQEYSCRQYCNEYKIDVSEVLLCIYSAWKGKASREVLNVIDKINDGSILVVNYLDRLCRHKDIGQEIIELCIKKKIKIHSVHEGIFTFETLENKQTFLDILKMAQNESEKNSQRQHDSNKYRKIIETHQIKSCDESHALSGKKRKREIDNNTSYKKQKISN